MEIDELKETNDFTKKTITKQNESKPSQAFVVAGWLALATGFIAYNIGLYNSDMQLNEKGYYFTIMLFGLFSVIALQKNVRDKMDGIPVTNIFFSISWAGVLISIGLLIIGLFNADLLLSEKGFFGMSFVLSLFAALSVQKNTRDSIDTSK